MSENSSRSLGGVRRRPLQAEKPAIAFWGADHQTLLASLGESQKAATLSRQIAHALNRQASFSAATQFRVPGL